MNFFRNVHFCIVFILCFFLIGGEVIAAKQIKNIPCQKIVDHDTYGLKNKVQTKYQIYYFKDKNKKGSECIMILAHSHHNMVVNGKKYNYLYDGYDRYYTSPVNAAEDILAHHIKTGDIRKSYDYVWFGSDHTNRFNAENKLPISRLRLWILRMEEMYYSYNNGILKIWDGNPN